LMKTGDWINSFYMYVCLVDDMNIGASNI